MTFVHFYALSYYRPPVLFISTYSSWSILRFHWVWSVVTDRYLTHKQLEVFHWNRMETSINMFYVSVQMNESQSINRDIGLFTTKTKLHNSTRCNCKTINCIEHRWTAQRKTKMPVDLFQRLVRRKHLKALQNLRRDRRTKFRRPVSD